MPRHGQDHAREDVMASATATPVDTGTVAAIPVDTTRRPRAHVDGAGPTTIRTTSGTDRGRPAGAANASGAA